MNKKLLLYFLFLPILFTGCQPEDKNTSLKHSVNPVKASSEPVVVDLFPFDDVPSGITSYVYSNLLKIYPNVKLHQPIPMPRAAFYAAKNRYRADTLIDRLAHGTPDRHVSMALTTKDISCTKGNIPDWGIFGLSYCPGKACIASTYRLKKYKDSMKQQFFKIAIHELGHTMGLDHCPVNTCFMRDAKGGSPFHEEKDFCPKCKSVLKKAGWQL